MLWSDLIWRNAVGDVRCLLSTHIRKSGSSFQHFKLSQSIWRHSQSPLRSNDNKLEVFSLLLMARPLLFGHLTPCRRQCGNMSLYTVSEIQIPSLLVYICDVCLSMCCPFVFMCELWMCMYMDCGSHHWILDSEALSNIFGTLVLQTREITDSNKLFSPWQT